MSFKKIIFNYTPPPTLSTPVGTVIPPTPNVAAETLLGEAYQTSNAGQLVQTMQNLKATAGYLSSAISSLSSGIGVTVDTAVDTDLTIALSRLYNSSSAIPAISLTMYQNLLQAEQDITRTDLYLDSDSPLQISPIQRADIMLATTSFEQALAAGGSYATSLPLLLNQMAGDSLIFDNITAQLQSYPVLANNDPSGIDVSDTVTSLLNDIATRQTTTYATTYSMIATPDPVSMTLPAVVTTLTQHPLNQLGQILTMLTSLMAIFHKPQQVNSAVGLNITVLPRLISDLTSHLFIVDKLLQMTINLPTSSNPSAVGACWMGTGIGSVQSIIPQPYGSFLSAGLTPILMSSELASQQAQLNQQIRSKTAPTTPANVNALPSGLLTMGATLNFSMEQNQLHATAIQTNTSKALDRRLNENGDNIEVMSSMKAMATMIGTVQGLVSAVGSGAQVATPSSAPSNLQVVGQVVGNLQNTTGTSYSVQGNNVVLTSPTLPAPSAQVSSVLQSGGATIVGPNSLYKVPIGA